MKQLMLLVGEWMDRQSDAQPDGWIKEQILEIGILHLDINKNEEVPVLES